METLHLAQVQVAKGGGLGRATLASEQVIYIESVQPSGGYPGYQGVIDNSTHRVNISIPYTNGNAGSYNAVHWTVATLDGAGEGGSKKRIKLDISGGTMNPSGGNITGTLTVDGDGTFLPKRQPVPVSRGIYEQDVVVFNVKLGVQEFTLKVKARGGVPDAQFNKQTNGKYEHQFVYLPVKDQNGKTWLNHNLGANYANFAHVAFNPAKVPQSYDDYNSFGSLPQIGAPMDGSELINWRGPADFVPVYPVGEWYDRSSYPRPPKDPCPDGYRIPAQSEFPSVDNSFEKSYNSPLHLTVSPGRYYRDALIINQLQGNGRYWTKYSVNQYDDEGNINNGSTYFYYRALGPSNSIQHTSSGLDGALKFGLSVRCIKK